jgi:hypothetical protein
MVTVLGSQRLLSVFRAAGITFLKKVTAFFALEHSLKLNREAIQLSHEIACQNKARAC